MSSYKPVVAIVGSKGFLGKPTIDAITSSTFRNNFTFPIRVITRKINSDSVNTPDIKYYEGSDEKSYEAALKGVDALIDLRGFEPLKSTDLTVAAKNAGVKLYIPSDFGSDYYNVGKYEPIFKVKADNVAFARKQSGLKVVQIHSGYFIDTTISPIGLPILSIDLDEGVADFVGDGSTVVSLTSVKNIGESIASVISHQPSDIPDLLHLGGDSVKISQVADQYEKYSGKKLQRKSSTVEEAVALADDNLNTGKVQAGVGKAFFEVLRAISESSGGCNFSEHNNNEFVNPGGKLFKWDSVEEHVAKVFKQ